MNWHEATQRQVGAPGIGEVRQLLADARDGAAKERRERSLVITALTALVMVAVLVVGLPTPSVAQPLPPGTYTATTPGGDVSVTVASDGEVAVEAPSSLVVTFDVDDDGRVLDTFTVSRGGTTWDVSLDVAHDGTYGVDVVHDSDADDGDKGGPAPVRDTVPGAGVEVPDDPVPSRSSEASDAADEPPSTPSARDAADAADDTQERTERTNRTDRSAATPGQMDDTPGRSGDTPGHTDDTPGRSGDARGQTVDPPGPPGSPPGRADARAPGGRGTD